VSFLGDHDSTGKEETVERHWLSTIFDRPISGKVWLDTIGTTNATNGIICRETCRTPSTDPGLNETSDSGIRQALDYLNSLLHAGDTGCDAETVDR
jgi:hypothetical protein